MYPRAPKILYGTLEFRIERIRTFGATFVTSASNNGALSIGLC